MKQALGWIMIIGGFVFGLWAGIWWAFIGGIVGLVSAFKAPDISSMTVALSIARIVLACGIGVFSFSALALPGWLLVSGGTRPKTKYRGW